MKSNVFLNKLSLILFLGVLFALSCTKNDREHDSPLSIYVPNSQDNVRMGDEIQIESEFIFIDTIPVISEIVDMVQVENNCYVLDNNKVLSCIDMREGRIISQWKDKFFYYALINPEIARFIIKDINPSQSMLIKYRIAS